MPISPKQRRWLKQRAHHLKPVVLIGQRGLTEAVLAEIERALDDHELIKIRLGALETEDRLAVIDHICQKTGSELIQRIGHIAAFYRYNPHKRDPLTPLA
ncbi:ribosome assembly RNA-binding protein YhbY [Caldichromatium japonicum]|uniref:Ribosome assembly RNA-binding protein YhbY n=1 Tax=Caldichromatium japonicum TaxID=2699430 RepID=A0A6G7VGD7_9GAMM|nr:ribosome assembly RNA-binding protein YhbY [Caldichromatium japonicum]QIK39109.1 ribosome assembly RNA-binding protein YhbY [Caldichromatium japonicum]